MPGGKVKYFFLSRLVKTGGDSKDVSSSLDKICRIVIRGYLDLSLPGL
jgi:hypothetical protein